tara:strand:- start:380 stop:565 length:186 start_codon:yes stop_codon:yes gene_type:complete
MKLKEYVLRIVYNAETGEIEHLSECVDQGCAFELDGELFSLPSEIVEFLEKHSDSNVLGIT